ncbi:enoyl-CoA hydratase/isomerase family protein [Streptomyces fuscichromogenes]|uniref:enoyl-CoA hydratase/isomerase family protein n=1 Tax=Streptomyces fuscichromogenes TaxID=1324013 RepID=UPI0037FAC57D
MSEVEGAVRYSVSDGVGRITLNRPDLSNAIDLATARELKDVVGRAADDDAVRTVLVDGEGERFCGGGDLASMLAAPDRTAYVEELALVLDDAMHAVAALDKVVVAGVHGAVAGASLALLLSCDLVVADQSTRFVGAYSSVGFVPDCGLSWLLPRAVGQQRALELLLTGRRLSAPEAHDWGLVTTVVPDGTARGSAEELAAELAAGPAWALGQTRALVRGAWASDRSAVGRAEAATIARASATPESAALLKRFAKR